VKRYGHREWSTTLIRQRETVTTVFKTKQEVYLVQLLWMIWELLGQQLADLIHIRIERAGSLKVHADQIVHSSEQALAYIAQDDELLC